MAAMICDVCGNDYDKPLEITYLGGTYTSTASNAPSTRSRLSADIAAAA
jgi:hypothetical protein